MVSYNVGSFRAGVDAVRGALEETEPDLVLLQDCGTRRHLLELAAGLRMESHSSHRAFHAYRNAVLYRPQWRLSVGQVRRLPSGGGSTQRGFVVAFLRRRGLRVAAISARLGAAAGEREVHARQLTDFEAGLGLPAVLGVDMNEAPDGAATRWIAARMFDAFAAAADADGDTFPVSAPSVRMDHLFVTEGVLVMRAWCGSGSVVERASDHRPVFADADVESEGEGGP